MKKLRLVVLLGGPGSERQVSIASGKNIVSALSSKENSSRYVVRTIDARDPKRVLEQLKAAKPDVIFPIVHGTFGEDGTLQAILEIFGKPYVGSRVLASALAMDKVTSTKLLKSQGLSTPPLLDDRIAKFPCVVKPRASGSSVGVSIVRSRKDLNAALRLAKREGEPMIQEFIQGLELTCGVLEFERGNPFALPVTEIIPKSKFFDYKAKYTKGGSDEITPARIPSALAKKVQLAALLAHKTLGCRHISRSDFIISKSKKVYYLETNTAPGMTATSLIPQAARAAGISLPELAHTLVQATLLK